MTKGDRFLARARAAGPLPSSMLAQAKARLPSKASQALDAAALEYARAWTEHCATDKAIRAAHGSPHVVYTTAANIERISASTFRVTAAILWLQSTARAFGRSKASRDGRAAR